jgi:predicted exporter
LVTSIVGFVGILVAPFPGLREMAVFSSAGLLSAWLCVVLLYPVIPQATPRQGGAGLRLAGAYGRYWEQGDRRRIWVAITLLLLVALVGCFRLVPLDDFRLLQARDPVVSAEEEQVRARLGQEYASQFFLVFAENQALLLEREENLTGNLAALIRDEKLADYAALSRYVPSPSRQTVNRDLLRQLLAPESAVFKTLEETVGLPEHARTSFAEALAASAKQPPLRLEAWLANPISEPFRHLWLGQGTRAISAVTLSGVGDVKTLEEIAQRHDGVHFVNRVDDLSEIFNSYRSQTFWLTAASYLVVTLLLVVRYGLKGGVSVMVVPLAAGFIAFGALGFAGEPISLFNVMALLLVLGIGVDYGIFFREAGGVSPPTLLAVAMSAATTVLAFGLLAVSSTMAVHSFGLTLLIGIAVAFLVSPLSAVLFPPDSRLQAKRSGR